MKKPVILLIDDHEDMLTFLCNDLSTDYSIRIATNGNEALEIIKHDRVDLIVSDVMMPEMDGFVFCRRVKSDLTYNHIPIVLLTAKNTLKAKITGLELGADAYIEKPFSPEHLHVQIANLLSNRSKLKLHFEAPPPIKSASVLTDEDEKFLYKINLTILSNLSNCELDVDLLAELLNMSRSTLYRRIKTLSDLTPRELIHLTRLKRSAELLQQGKLRIFEIAGNLGFRSQTHFGQSFHKQFGMTPTQYMKQKNTENTTEV